MKTISRTQAIQDLRVQCVALTDDEHCMCEVASRLHILCGGFSRFSFGELKETYSWIVQNRPHITRQELEDLGNRWHLARQRVSGDALACDQQLGERVHPICEGWANFDEAELARFHAELCGEEIEVVPDREAT